VVWENVPGAFSSNKGMDFRAVLQEIGQTEIPMPTNGKWANAGMAELPQCEIAWRVLDAQYWGVPQRRRRIFLVADFAAYNRCAGEILFECKSVSGDFEKSEGAREGTAGRAESGARTAGREYTRAAGFYAGGSAGAVGYQVECAATLTTRWGGQAPTVAIYDMTHADEVMRHVKSGIAPTLNARMGTGGNQVPVVQESRSFDAGKSPCVDEPQVIAVQGSMIGRSEKNGPQGSGLSDVCFTLNTVDRHAVASYVMTTGSYMQIEKEKSPTLMSRDYKDPNVVCVGNGQADNARLQEKAGALNCMHDQQCVMFSKTSFAKYEEVDNTTSLRASGGDIGGGSENLCCQSFVRRLTPTECERLQGLPDGYTLIEDKSCSDSARYKALGNGMAKPCSDYVLRRLAEAFERE